MNRIIVRYKVKSECAQQNEDLIKAVFAELDSARPKGLEYAAYKLEDGLTFIHHAVITAADGVNPLPSLGAFKAFVSDIKTRCDEPPLALSADEIGSYKK